MSEKEQQSTHPIQVSNGYVHPVNTEAMTAHDAQQLRKKKRNKCILYIVIIALLQAIIIGVLAGTLLRVQTPRFRISSATFESFNAGTQTNPSVNARMNTQFFVRNTNFGRYRYQDTSVQFLYRGAQVGEVVVPSARVGWRTTRRFVSAVDLTIQSNTQLSNDMGLGIVPITSQARMRGRVELLSVMRRNRNINMNCSMEIVTATRELRNIRCN